MKVIAFLLFATAFVISSSVLAGSSQKDAVVHGESKTPVMTKDGMCVRTKWDANMDKCHHGQQPETVVIQSPPEAIPVQPAPEFSQPTLEQRTIYFEFDKSFLTPPGRMKLNSLADVANKNKAVKRMSVIGYTDVIGTDSYNQSLSERRANTVADYLKTKVSIPVDVLEVRGLGESNTQTSCAASLPRQDRIACTFKDRRVEVELVAE